jgi:starch synthase (maltosyl-transferring)
VTPSVDCGRYPAKAVVGELVPVSACAYREGRDALGCAVVWRDPDGVSRPPVRMQPGDPGTDTWHATIRPDAIGEWTFAVEAFSDPYRTWHHAVSAKLDAGQGVADLANDLAEGATILDRSAALVPPGSKARVMSAAPRCGPSCVRCPSMRASISDLLWEYPRELAESPCSDLGDRHRAVLRVRDVSALENGEAALGPAASRRAPRTRARHVRHRGPTTTGVAEMA